MDAAFLEEALGVTTGPAKSMDRDIDAELRQDSHIVRDEGFRGKWELHHDIPDPHPRLQLQLMVSMKVQMPKRRPRRSDLDRIAKRAVAHKQKGMFERKDTHHRRLDSGPRCERLVCLLSRARER